MTDLLSIVNRPMTQAEIAERLPGLSKTAITWMIRDAMSAGTLIKSGFQWDGKHSVTVYEPAIQYPRWLYPGRPSHQLNQGATP